MKRNATNDATNDATPAPLYPPGTTQRLVSTDLVTPATRAVLEARLSEYAANHPASAAHAAAGEHRYGEQRARPSAPRLRFFTRDEMDVLDAACAQLIPQPDRAQPIELALAIDRGLASGTGDGWRYADMPPDGEAYRLGLRGLNETAREMFDGAGSFASLDPARRDAVLATVQTGTARGAVWTTMPAPRFFEELLVQVTKLYYSHPLAMDEIGYAGYADARGWQRVAPGELAPFEPRPIRGDADVTDAVSNRRA